MRVQRATLALFVLLGASSAAAQSATPASVIPIAVPLIGGALDSAASHLVRLSGTVAAVRTGLGDHSVTLVNHIPGTGTASVVVEEPSAGTLENFEPNDDVSVTGVLVRGTGPSGNATYSLRPRSANDIVPIGWTRVTERRATVAVITIISLILVGIVAVQSRRDARFTQRSTAAAIRESEARYRLLVEESPVGILVHRLGHVLFANSAFTKMVGIPDDTDLVGERLVDLISPVDQTRASAWFRSLRKRRDANVRSRERFHRIDGTALDIEVVATQTTFAGKPAVQVVVHDVTVQAGLEDQRRQAQKMEAIGQLAAGVAHDFNNVLTAIAAYTQLILDSYPLSNELQHDVVEIQRAGERASGLTKQLLAVSRRQLVLADVVNLNDVVESSASVAQHAIGSSTSLNVALSETACPVFADRTQLDTVLTNLVINARDAMPNGGALTIETRFKDIDEGTAERIGIEPGEYVALVVRDSGVGMSPETLGRVFEPFFTTKPAGGGAGLGLATMYGIVTGARGHVSAKSAPDAGSEFTVLLPRVRAVPARKGILTRGAAKGTRSHVLLIEDETSVRTAARRVLERNGHQVTEARDAADAAALWDEAHGAFDCIVTDVVLPGEPGPRVVERFRAARPEIPVLFVSGYTDRALDQMDVDAAHTAFLQKPFEPKQLAGAVSTLLSESAAAA